MRECYKIKNLFGSYIYNNITPEEKAKVDKHIKTCQQCAEDLKTQQEALNMIKIPISIDDNALQFDQDRFMWNVYRRIASESMKHRSRQVNLRKFVLQPAIATVAIVFIMAFAMTRYDNTKAPESSFIPVASSVSTALPEIAAEKVKQTSDVTVKNESSKPKGTTVASRSSNVKKQPANVKQAQPNTLLTEARISNSRDWLMNADLINYSLREPRRALSRYQMIIDHYPDTDAAKEAQKRIKTILDSEFGNQNEETALETGSNAGI
jgi:hypothetical protein